MIVYKMSLDFEGESLIPEELIPELSSELEVVDSLKPSDTFTRKGRVEQYGFGSVSMMHPDLVCIDENYLEAYENSILNFLKFNYKSIIKNGGSKIDIWYEVYYTANVFSFNLFSRQQWKIIGNCNAQILFSTYKMTQKEIKEFFLS